ncbi:MAG TPA: hypothetical protein VJ696_04145, partial [Rhodanobacteraceae bacterium]|nr:hypothetical protein [Rhodanobacteraceae bacterium]
FSDEFYEFVPQHLTENGVYVQWLQLYEITPALVGSVLKAMLPHFADVNAYLSNEGDMILVAAPRGRLPALGDPGFDPALAGELARLAMNRREYLAQFGLMGKSGLAALAAMSDVPPNSDLFPVLQIYAPEARFMKASALAISDLQRAPAPLLEVLGEYSPPAVATEPSPAPTRLRRDVPSRAARAYREALLSGAAASSPFANKDVAGSLAILRSAAPACAGLDPDRWIEASVAVAEATIPYLSAQDLDGVWIEPRWTPDCIREIHATAAALAFHAAFAARDWSRVARDGSLLLAGGKLRGEWQSYVVLGTGLAYVALGDWSRFNELDAASASSLNHEFELAFLKSVATAAGRSAAAGNAVTARD